jgi:hypothetical protein
MAAAYVVYRGEFRVAERLDRKGFCAIRPEQVDRTKSRIMLPSRIEYLPIMIDLEKVIHGNLF